METTKFVRKPFYVEAVQVTHDNLDEVAKWSGGHIEHVEQPLDDHGHTVMRPFVKVDVQKPMSDRQTQAFVGDWVLKAPQGFKVYTPRAFENSFQPAPPVVVNHEEKPTPKIHVGD